MVRSMYMFVHVRVGATYSSQAIGITIKRLLSCAYKQLRKLFNCDLLQNTRYSFKYNTYLLKYLDQILHRHNA